MDYASLVGGKLERSLITYAVKEDKGKLERIVIGKQARIQMTWWLLNMKEVEDEWPGAVDVSMRRSVVLDRWIQDHIVDRDLARRLLREVQSRVEVQIGMDYTMEMEEMVGEKRLG